MFFKLKKENKTQSVKNKLFFQWFQTDKGAIILQ